MIRPLRFLSLWLVALLPAACGDDLEDIRVAGLIERDRIELVAEAQEPIVQIIVREGDRVAVHDPILRLDDTVLSAQMRQALSARDREAARVDELVRGPRIERIDAARARLNGAEDALVEAERSFERARKLLGDGTISQSFYDETFRQLNEAKARRDEAKAQLTELLQGTTEEELAQARANLAQAEAMVVAADTRVDRLTVRAPQAGIVDALPFELGERPQAGAVVAVMLAGATPYVRCYIPAELRISVMAGTRALVHVDTLDAPLTARVRFVSSEAAFTPFFALTEHDRGRLSYLAEIDIEDEAGARLPTGLPVEVSFDFDVGTGGDRPDDLMSQASE